MKINNLLSVQRNWKNQQTRYIVLAFRFYL